MYNLYNQCIIKVFFCILFDSNFIIKNLAHILFSFFFSRNCTKRKIVCVYDQPIYSKAFQIKYKEVDKFQEVFLMMGTVHVILASLAGIVARFKQAGLCDIVA